MTIISEIQVSYKPGLTSSTITIANADDAYSILKGLFSADTISLQEEFIVLYLNRANKVIGSYKLSKGGISGTVADIRLILSVALKTLASGLILAHNHPSGNLKPSQADIGLTKRVREAAKLMDMEVLDHIIISNEGFYSFTDGLL